MGLFNKIKKLSIFSGFFSVDEDFFEELEENLILSDMGMDTTMEAVEELPARFDFPTDFSVRTFFRDCYGVLRDPQCEPQRIVLRAYYPFAHYLRTLPLHPSQQELTATPQYADFELYLRPTFDFKQELLAQGREVEVLQPASLREEMKQMVREMMERYMD